ncbi:MAG: hypothetical protein RMA76_31405 [Deltaproteobacteria bacterium]|jgi:cytochrome c553
MRLRASAVVVVAVWACDGIAPPSARDGGAVRRDAGASRDAGTVRDGGVYDGGVDCIDRLTVLTEPPDRLSELGLYEDFARRTIAADVEAFSPRFELWSDGADKRRWLYLPRCNGPIDSIDMDDWRFPVGTRAFKEFSVNGQPIETRMVHRTGPGIDDFMFVHYLWAEDGSDAFLVTEETDPALLEDAHGYDYDVPSAGVCIRCHGERGGDPGGLSSRFLGVSAVQLGHDGPGVTLRTLSERGALARPRPEGVQLPGDEVTSAALGYLHANCAHCHNEDPDAVPFPNHPFSLQLGANDSSIWDTGAYRTAVDVEIRGFFGGCGYRVALGDPEDSCVFTRIRVRGEGESPMPPILSDRVHQAGLERVRAWLTR